MESDVVQQMRAVRLDDVTAHTRLVLALQTVGMVQRALWNRIQDGHAAAEEIRVRGRRID